MSTVNELSLNLFYGSTPLSAAPTDPYQRPLNPNAKPVKHTKSVRKRPRYPTVIPSFPSFDTTHPPQQLSPTEQKQPEDDDSREDEGRPAAKKYIKPAPLRELPKLKARLHSELPASALLTPASALSNPALFSSASVSFTALSLSTRLVDTLSSRLSITTPTRIQSLAIPPLLARHDALIRSATGTGKTLAYLLPLLQSLTDVSLTTPLTRQSGVLAIVLAPTRELVIQIHATLSALLLSFHWLVSTALMGGEAKAREKARLRKGVNVIVATPGRLMDHLQTTERLRVDRVRWLVLDEADRLLSMGLGREVSDIVKRVDDEGKRRHEERKEVESGGMEGRRQTVLVSATIDKDVQQLADVALDTPVFIGFDNTTTPATPTSPSAADASPSASTTIPTNSLPEIPDTITHYYLQVESRHRLVALCAFLRQQLLLREKRGLKCKVIVFFATCNSVEFHYQLLSALFWPPNTSSLGGTAGGADATGGEAATPLLTCPLYKLHGNINQNERTATYHAYSSSSSSLLLCTDVAARGLHLPAVDWIVQYDVAEDSDEYVHRVGRCGRVGREGQGVLFLTEKELGYLQLLPPTIAFTSLPLAPILSSLRLNTTLPAPSTSSLPAGALLQRLIESIVSGRRDVYESAVRGYQSWVRAYAGKRGKHMRRLFHVGMLHLGHVCRSFGLGDEPTRVGKVQLKAKAAGEGGEADGVRTRTRKEEDRDKAKAEKAKERVAAAAGGSDKGRGQSKRAETVQETVALFKKRQVDSMSEFAA